MTANAQDLRSGKGDRDENFPVASRLIHPRHRGIILAFYNFVRTADDIADHAELSETEKLAHLDALEACLLGGSGADPAGLALHEALAARDLPPDHARDLLTAFRLDVTKRRYRDWDDLIDYCRYSAMPVGRFVLDVHGESRDTWPANDALCAALQVINHLQDCGKDFRSLDRVYLPLDALDAAGARIEHLGAERASPALLACLHGLAARTEGLLGESRRFRDGIADFRLALEVSVIQTLAERLVAILKTRDPLCERVHLEKGGVAAAAFAGITTAVMRRPFRRRTT